MQTYENLIKSYHIFFNSVKFFIRLISHDADVSSTIQRASAIRAVASDGFLAGNLQT